MLEMLHMAFHVCHLTCQPKIAEVHTGTTETVHFVW